MWCAGQKKGLVPKKGTKCKDRKGGDGKAGAGGAACYGRDAGVCCSVL